MSPYNVKGRVTVEAVKVDKDRYKAFWEYKAQSGASKSSAHVRGSYLIQNLDGKADPIYWAEAMALWTVLFKGPNAAYYGKNIDLDVQVSSKRLKEHLIEPDYPYVKFGPIAQCIVVKGWNITSVNQGGFNSLPNSAIEVDVFGLPRDLDEVDPSVYLEPITYNIPQVGRCVMSWHAYSRFVGRHLFTGAGESKEYPGSAIRTELLAGIWEQVEFPRHVAKKKRRKYKKQAKYFRKKGSDLHLTLTSMKSNDGRPSYLLETLYWMNAELSQPSK